MNLFGELFKNVYGALDQTVDQTKELCPGVPIPIEGLNPFKATMDADLMDGQGVASRSEEA